MLATIGNLEAVPGLHSENHGVWPPVRLSPATGVNGGVGHPLLTLGLKN
jgi:hypothetical protein